MPSGKNEQPKKSKGGKKNSLEERIHRHLNDKNDKITDEDIRDIVVGQPRGGENNSEDEADVTIKEEAKKMEDEIPKKGKKDSSWDVLGGD